jgi:hypothetical protein
MARQQLKEIGFLVMRDGLECPTYYEQEEPERKPLATIPYAGVIRTTNAKQ